MAASAVEKIWSRSEQSEPLGEFSAIALAETGDQRFLAVEINVERPGADTRFAADRLHRRRVKAPRAKQVSAASRMCSRRARCVSGFSFGIWSGDPEMNWS